MESGGITLTQTRTNYNRTAYNRTNYNRTVTQTNRTSTRGGAYVYGNTARQLDVRRQLEEEPRRQLSHEVRKNREKAHHMNFGYVVFLMAAFMASAFILINYIQLQSELTNRTKGLAKLESQLNTLKLSNDEEYSRITSNVDLEEVKRVAIGELGMTYAEEGQIVTYSGVENDYMRKVGQDGQ